MGFNIFINNSLLIDKIYENEIETINISHEKSTGGRGGMISKINTAKKLLEIKIPVYIVNGKKPDAICSVFGRHFYGTILLPNPS